MTEGALNQSDVARASLAASFGVASGVLLVGVLLAWVALETDVDPIDVTVTTTASRDHRSKSAPVTIVRGSLLEQAEFAFAAGRVVEPEFDNALGYYLAVLEDQPANTDALAGIDRIVGFLESEAEGAVFRSDWDAARAYIDRISSVRQLDEKTLELKARVDRLERIDALTLTAAGQFAAGQLVTPRADNAAETYREILALDAGSEVATQGIRSIAQRLVASAQAAAFAGDAEKAERYLAQLQGLDPQAEGLAQVQRSLQEMRMSADRAVQSDLMAASQALEADRLVPPSVPNAYDLFSRVLARQPDSEPASRGIELVRGALVERIRSQIAQGAIDGMEAALIAARSSGVENAVLYPLEADARHAVRLVKARAGEFAELYPLEQLTVVGQPAPRYPRSAASRGLDGWVDVEFTVTEDGDVRDAVARESSSGLFENAALAAVNRWRFEPVVEENRPVPVRTRTRFTFRP